MTTNDCFDCIFYDVKFGSFLYCKNHDAEIKCVKDCEEKKKAGEQ